MKVNSKIRFHVGDKSLNELKNVLKAQKMLNLSIKKSMRDLSRSLSDFMGSTLRNTQISTTSSMNQTCITLKTNKESRKLIKLLKSLRISMLKTKKMKFLKTKIMQVTKNSIKCGKQRPVSVLKLSTNKRVASNLKTRARMVRTKKRVMKTVSIKMMKKTRRVTIISDMCKCQLIPIIIKNPQSSFY